MESKKIFILSFFFLFLGLTGYSLAATDVGGSKPTKQERRLGKLFNTSNKEELNTKKQSNKISLNRDKCQIFSARKVEAKKNSQLSSSTGRQVIIGLVQDGDSKELKELVRLVRLELNRLFGGKKEIKFKSLESFDLKWDLKRKEKVVKSALADPEVDIIFACGILVTNFFAQPGLKLNKPVVGGLLLDPQDMGLMNKDKTLSKKKNFNFLCIKDQSRKNLEAFKELVNLSSVHILVDSKILRAIKGLKRKLKGLGQELGIGINFISAGRSLENLKNKINEQQVEGVYLTPCFRMSYSDWHNLLDFLNEGKIPTFSLLGHQEVRQGVLAGLASDFSTRMSRRIALNIQEIAFGTQAKELDSVLKLSEHLMINGKTAERIGVSPGLETVLDAEIVQAKELMQDRHKVEVINLEKAMLTAKKKNPQIPLESAGVHIKKAESGQALSALLPQIQASMGYQEIDEDRARSSVGLYPRRRTDAGLSLKQMIFNDSYISKYLASKRLAKKQIYEYKAFELEAMKRAGLAYLDYLQAQKILEIEKDNLDLTRENLRLAKMRNEVGMSGPEDVYRWEAQEAEQKSRVFKARSRLDQARAELSYALGKSQNLRYQARDIHLKGNEIYFLNDYLNKFLQNTKQVKRLEVFSVSQAKANSPELQAVSQALKAAEINLAEKKRSLYLPNVGARFDYNYVFHEDDLEPERQTLSQQPSPGTGAVYDPLAGLTGNTDDHEYLVALQLNLPIVQGGRRLCQIQEAEFGLSKLRAKEKKIEKILEQRTLQSVYALYSSKPRIRLARVAADRAKKNLDVVQSKYAAGTVSILDLLDAQNQTVIKKKSAAIAVYDYLKDLIQLQRAMAWFECTKSREEKLAWVEEFKKFSIN